MKKTGLSLLFALTAFTFLTAQNRILELELVFGAKPLQLHTSLPFNETGDSVQIETCKFYVSGIQLLQNNKVFFSEYESYHLIDAADSVRHLIPLKTPPGLKADRMQFLLGIDSLTNASGVKGHALDPIHGMYWAWQSGYVHVKIEGRFISGDKQSAFQYHLGGFLGNLLAAEDVLLPVGTADLISVQLDFLSWLKELQNTETRKIMSPSTEAVSLTQKLASNFHLKPKPEK